jgi:hypothetical protein
MGVSGTDKERRRSGERGAQMIGGQCGFVLLCSRVEKNVDVEIVLQKLFDEYVVRCFNIITRQCKTGMLQTRRGDEGIGRKASRKSRDTRREEIRPSNTGRQRAQQRRKRPRRITSELEPRKATTQGRIQNKQGTSRPPSQTTDGDPASGTRPRNKQDKSKCATPRHAMAAGGFEPDPTV